MSSLVTLSGFHLMKLSEQKHEHCVNKSSHNLMYTLLASHSFSSSISCAQSNYSDVTFTYIYMTPFWLHFLCCIDHSTHALLIPNSD